ncbi:glycogen/starch/alpha-glucan phosphorylase [Cryptosporangium phraense]|uniref:Glycogen/starch/alpha-glucan phosphorylase n=1 Tax=Cryptosporangium phraense TaxID=2593070 RepID=A0A545AW09_9ACTN|nr:glycogen/starch/alpha-glucan phosphorylase [Cryptosporangium phraense]TQS45510.1 glycogen/starch/alpha-glucan phosphorylase [Cryptosporangium phraense]
MSGDELWDVLVDEHMDSIWGIATTAGLERTEAAVVSQLTWLRMAERWPTVRALANAKDPARHPVEQPTTQVDEWILHTARSEVDAWVRDEQRRGRESLFADGGVVRLAPGFAPADSAGPTR